MRKTALIIAAGFAALTVSASVGHAQTRVVVKKPAFQPVQTTLGQPKAGVTGTAKPATGAGIKIAPGVNGAGMVAAGGLNMRANGGNGMVAAGGLNMRR